jgi:hypothetical protein
VGSSSELALHIGVVEAEGLASIRSERQRRKGVDRSKR